MQEYSGGKNSFDQQRERGYKSTITPLLLLQMAGYSRASFKLHSESFHTDMGTILKRSIQNIHGSSSTPIWNPFTAKQ